MRSWTGGRSSAATPAASAPSRWPTSSAATASPPATATSTSRRGPIGSRRGHEGKRRNTRLGRQLNQYASSPPEAQCGDAYRRPPRRARDTHSRPLPGARDGGGGRGLRAGRAGRPDKDQGRRFPQRRVDGPGARTGLRGDLGGRLPWADPGRAELLGDRHGPPAEGRLEGGDGRQAGRGAARALHRRARRRRARCPPRSRGGWRRCRRRRATGAARSTSPTS